MTAEPRYAQRHFPPGPLEITPVSQGYIPLHQTPAIRKSMRKRFGIDPAQTHPPHPEKASACTLWLAQNAMLGDQEDLDGFLAAIQKIQYAWS